MALRLAMPQLADYLYLAQRMRPDEQAQFLALSGLTTYDADTAARALALSTGPSWVLVGDDGLPVLAGGFEPERPGVWVGWQVGTLEGWAQHWRAITRMTRRINDDMLARDDCHRLQIIAVTGRDKACEWYERGLGYVREAVLRRYCADGQDAISYARTAP
jgi:hypothetical protein